MKIVAFAVVILLLVATVVRLTSRSRKCGPELARQQATRESGQILDEFSGRAGYSDGARPVSVDRENRIIQIDPHRERHSAPAPDQSAPDLPADR
jgi:hypothetical protein